MTEENQESFGRRCWNFLRNIFVYAYSLLIRFWKIVLFFVAVIAVIIIIPMCYGIKFHDIWAWYKTKLPFHEFVAIRRQVTSDKPSGKDSSADEVKLEKQYAVWKVKEVNTGEYKPATPQTTAQKKTKTSDDVEQNEEKPVLKKWNIEQEKKDEQVVVPEYHPYVKKEKKSAQDVTQKKAERLPLNQYYKVLDENQNLEYLKEPQLYSGQATVVGSNSLYVDDKFMYLYGIYSDPNIHDLVQAQEFLVKQVDGKNIDCYVVAYTIQTQTATALCFKDEVLLNKALVDKFLADNIALK